MDGRFRSCFEESVREQGADLDELLEAMQSERREREAELRELVEKNMRHHEEYAEKRRALARDDGPTFFCPPWCSAFENSFLWLGGCRPSLSIRLLYAVSGYELEAHLDNLLASGSNGAAFPGGLVGLSASQLALVNDLHSRTLEGREQAVRQDGDVAGGRGGQDAAAYYEGPREGDGRGGAGGRREWRERGAGSGDGGVRGGAGEDGGGGGRGKDVDDEEADHGDTDTAAGGGAAGGGEAALLLHPRVGPAEGPPPPPPTRLS